MQLQSYASRTRPSIRCRCITFDLASSATFTGSHHYSVTQQGFLAALGIVRLTLQPLMSIMFVDKDIVWRWSAFDACGLDIRPEDLDGLLHTTYFSDSPGVQNSAAQKNNSACAHFAAAVAEY